jgi:hypothetical protein
MTMVLGAMQDCLADLYGLDLAYDVNDFLITDRALARALDVAGREVDEKLLIAEDGTEAEVSLFLCGKLVERLALNDPTTELTGENLADFWTAFEGVSHFTYFAFKAGQDQCVTLLEMELQAEVDKFVATALLLRRQGEIPPRGLHRWLFDMPSFDEQLGADEYERYERANHYAGKYCRRLWPRLESGTFADDLKRELRYFYRLPREQKIEHIGAH